MTGDVHSRMDERLRAIKKAGERVTGEKLGRKPAAKKKQKKTRYPRETRWFRLKRKDGD